MTRPASLALLYALAWALVAWQHLDQPFGLQDEGFLYYVASAWNEGLRPTAETRLDSYLAGVFLPVRVLFALVGEQVFAARLLLISALAATPVVFVAALRDRLSLPWLAFLAVGLALVPGPVHKAYVGLLNALLLAGLLAAWSQPTPRRVGALGALTGLFLTTRIDVGLLAVAAFPGWCLLHRGRGRPLREPVQAWLVGLVVGWLPVGLVLLAEGLVGGWLDQLLGFGDGMSGRVGAFVTVAPPPLEELARLGKRGAFAWLFWGSLAGPAALAAWVLRRLLQRPEGEAFDAFAAQVLVLGWTLGNLPQYVLERPDLPHVEQHLGAVWTATALAAAAWASTGGPGRLLQASLALWCVASPVLAWRATPTPEDPNPVVWTTLKDRPHPVPLRTGSGLPGLVNAVRERTDEGEAIACLPYAPGIAWLADRPLVDGWVYYVRETARPEREEALLEALRDVRVLVWTDRQGFKQDPALDVVHFMPRVHDAVETHFQSGLRWWRYELKVRRRRAGRP